LRNGRELPTCYTPCSPHFCSARAFALHPNGQTHAVSTQLRYAASCSTIGVCPFAKLRPQTREIPDRSCMIRRDPLRDLWSRDWSRDSDVRFGSAVYELPRSKLLSDAPPRLRSHGDRSGALHGADTSTHMDSNSKLRCPQWPPARSSSMLGLLPECTTVLHDFYSNWLST